MKNILLFLTGNYKKYLLVKIRKHIWTQYYSQGFTNTGYNIQESLKTAKL